MITVRVQSNDFDQNTEVRAITTPADGAVVSFLGIVRDNDDQSLVSITLEHYPEMTEKELKRIAAEADKRWSLSGITIIHRYGELTVGDQIVLVAVSSKHREVAFEAANFIMDFLKTDAPFWKKEKTQHTTTWVDAAEKDNKSRDKWQ